MIAIITMLCCQCRDTKSSQPASPPSSQKLRPPSKSQQSATPLKRYDYQQAMMGTRFLITFYAKDSPQGKSQADTAANQAFQVASQINAACSDYDVTSELMLFNAAPAHQPVPLNPLLFDVLSKALTIAKDTNGAYDPTLGQHSYNWRMARKKHQLPTTKQISQAQASSGWQKLKLNPNTQSATKTTSHMRFDLGGIAKGYAADRMLEVLQSHHFPQASITAGGEVRLGDPPPRQKGWPVTLKTLDSTHQLTPKTITLSNCAISTSGDLHQSITINDQRYSHIVNPKTGLGLTTRISATIIANNATLSDALATAYCVTPEQLHHFPQKQNIQSLIIWENNNGIRFSSGNLKRDSY